MSIMTEEVLLDENGDDLNERKANKGGFEQTLLIEDLGHYDAKRILKSLTNARAVVPLIFFVILLIFLRIIGSYAFKQY